MLYHLSYASKKEQVAPSGTSVLTDPIRMSGTTLEVTITARYVQQGKGIYPTSALSPGVDSSGAGGCYDGFLPADPGAQPAVGLVA